MTPSEIKPGMRFGHWTVLKYSHTHAHRIKYFTCKCDCGTVRNVRGVALLQGQSRACCRQCDNSLIGQKFGKLTVTAIDKSRQGYWLCNCDCGTIGFSAKTSALNMGKIKSCGCLAKSSSGRSRTKSEKAEKYENAIGKKFGYLTVLKSCDEWNFLCRCDCGKELKVDKYNLISENTQSCGCKRAETYLKNQKAKYEKLVGTEINWLTINECFYKNNSFWFNCTCRCGKKFTGQATKIATGYYSSCGCVKSSAEERFEEILKKYNIAFRREYKFPDCRDKAPLPFDFAIFNEFDELLGLVELNGQQHYTIGGWNTKEHLAYVQKHDKMKCKFCCDNEIPLLVIPYQFYDELEKFLRTSDFWQTITENSND